MPPGVRLGPSDRADEVAPTWTFVVLAVQDLTRWNGVYTHPALDQADRGLGRPDRRPRDGGG